MRKLAGSTMKGITAGVALWLTTINYFFSLATYHDHRNPCLNVKEWQHQAERRAFELPDSCHALVKLLLITQFGHCDMLPDEQLPGLDCVADSIVKSFHHITDSEITWPMFDDAARTIVC